MSAQVKELLPYGFGAIALLAVVLFFARPYLSTLATEAAKATPGAVRKLYRLLRPVGGRRLAQYRKSVQLQHRGVRLGLSGEGESGKTPGLRDVYVPLQCENGAGRTDATTQLRAADRTVLLGAPGAGKSLLLRYEMLEWAEKGGDKQIPVMIDLHGCNTRGESFEELIAEQFQGARIGSAADMVKDRLDAGELRIFFDGLDEVGRERLEQVVRSLRQFVSDHHACDMVVSCRTAAYDGRLDDIFDQGIRISEFDDASILRFLSQWPELTRAAAARIFRALQDDPELMVLARSPLMLTMIAYLQSGKRPDSVGPLPNSRAKFYDLAVAHLLDRDRLLNRSDAIGKYNAGRKTLVLQRLALSRLRASSARGDRQEIARADFEAVIDELLPGFDLERGPDLEPLLNEIVTRSELIKDIDRGRHFQFTHLTLLEYLAACELRTDEAQLMENYRRDPGPWRETLRMWCAETRGSCTRVVREVFEADELRHKVLALQCLADAVHIDEELAEEIIDHFLGLLGTPGVTGAGVARGLGALAASSGPRGRRVLGALMDIAGGPVSERRAAALRALTASCRQEAAQTLARLSDDGARRALQDMGDVAVPALAAEAQRLRHLWAVRSLGAIGTPAAAASLYRMLWDADDLAARSAAWQLASLLRNPEVRNEVAAQELPTALTRGYTWVSEAFRPRGLARLAGRVAWLMDGGQTAEGTGDGRPSVSTAEDREASAGVTAIHPLIGIPLFSCTDHLSVNPANSPEEWARLRVRCEAAADELGIRLRRVTPGMWDDAAALNTLFKDDRAATEYGASVLTPLTETLLHELEVPLIRKAVLRCLPWPVQAMMVSVRFGKHVDASLLTLQAKWRHVHEEPGPPHFFNRLAGAAGIALLAFWAIFGGARLLATSGWWHPWGQAGWGPHWLAYAALGVAGLGGVLLYLMEWDKIQSTFEDILLVSGLALWLAFLIYTATLAMVAAAELIGWPLAVAPVALLVGTALGCVFMAIRIDEMLDNALRDVLRTAQPPALPHTPHRS